MLSMADGDRALAKEAVRLGAARDLAPVLADPRAPLRTSWLLLRLEEFPEAIAHLGRRRPSADLVGLADAHEAYARLHVGPLATAASLGRRAARSDEPIGQAFGAGIAIRALLLKGRVEAAEVLSAQAHSAVEGTLGATVLRLSRGYLRVAQARHDEALELVASVEDDLRRVGTSNPAGWPWLTPKVRALVALGRPDEAEEAIGGVAEMTARWGTPVVRAELAVAHVLVSKGLRRRAALATLADALRDCPPGPYRTNAERLLTDGTPGPDDTVGDPLLALTPRVREVARLVAAGMRDREIADHLGISPRTVHRHVSTALARTGARSRTDLGRLTW